MNAFRCRFAVGRAKLSFAVPAVLLIVSSMTALVRAEDVSPQLASLLKKLPADSAAIRTELLKLSADDIRALCGMLVEPGTADDNAARYALHGLALAAADPGQDAARETYVKAVAQAFAGRPRDGAFLIEQLRLLGDPQVVVALAKGLQEERTCDAAARLLATVGGPGAMEALRAALPQARGPGRLSIIQALGALGDAQSVPTLLKDATSSDRELRLTALFALARSGDPQAEPLLQKATQVDSWYERSRATDFLLTYAARRAELKKSDDAARICRALYDTRTAPADTHVRCAAVSILAQALGTGAVKDLLAALADDNPQVRVAAANTAAALSGKDVTAAFLADLGQAAPVSRAGILGVLARRADVMALPAAIQALTDGEREVRLAAIAAVAALGREKAATPLVGMLATKEQDERKAAQDALARLPGDAVTKVLVDALPVVTPRARVALLEVLAARPPTGDLAPLYAAAGDADGAVRTAALRTLGVLAGDKEVPALLKLLIGAQSDGEREAGGQAVADAARRAKDRDQPAALVVAALKGQNEPTRAALLRVLGRVGGKQALDSVLAGTNDSSAVVKEAAVRAFSDWPDDEPAPQVLTLAQKLDDAKLQVLALRAYVRLIELNKGRPTDRTLEMCAAALQAARRPDEKKLVLARLGDVKEVASLKMLEPYRADPALGAEASAAMMNIIESFIPARWRDARPPLDALLAADLPDQLRKRAKEVLKELERYEDYILDWWVAGPYMEPGKEGKDLFDVKFPPEQPGAAKIEWRQQPLHPDGWLVELHALMGGDHRAGYLFTRVHSPRAQKVRLELGSDDGIKVWLNGELVHAKNAMRSCEPADDKLDVTLKEGQNTLMLKVTNGVGGWAACARFRTLDGGRLEGVKAQRGEKP